MSSIDDFMKEVQEAETNTGSRSDYFKLQDGDNRIVILTNPKRYGEVFGLGIAFHDSGYSKYASNKFMCYVLDLKDNKIKLARLSYTTAQQLLALAQGARTKFTNFPMPYVVNLKTENAGSKEIKTNILAEEDFEMTEELVLALSSLDTVEVILTRMKDAQKKKIDENKDGIREKIANFIAKKEVEYKERGEKMKKEQEVPTIQVGETDYPEEDIDLKDIPF